MSDNNEKILKDYLANEMFFAALSELFEMDIRGYNTLERENRDPQNHVFSHGATRALRKMLNRLSDLHGQAQEEIASGQV